MTDPLPRLTISSCSICGWSMKKPSTERIAAYAHRLHRCDRKRHPTCAICGGRKPADKSSSVCPTCAPEWKRRRLDAVLEKCIVRASSGCWVWVGALSPEGYGRYGSRYAHRIMHERHIGPIPTGYEVDHLCRNRACVNPAHLEAVTQQENIRRQIAAKFNGHCIRGHEMTPENTYLRPDGEGRQCRQCIKIRSARLGAKRKAARLTRPAVTADLGETHRWEAS